MAKTSTKAKRKPAKKAAKKRASSKPNRRLAHSIHRYAQHAVYPAQEKIHGKLGKMVLADKYSREKAAALIEPWAEEAAKSYQRDKGGDRANKATRAIVVEKEIDMWEAEYLKPLTRQRKRGNPKCRAGQIKVDRKAYRVSPTARRSGYKVPRAKFCIDDPGRPGRRARGSESGPYANDPAWIRHEGKLGGPGYTDKPTRTRHAILHRCVKQYDYRSCLGSLMALLRSTELLDDTRMTLESDKSWLMAQHGGPGSFSKKKAKRKSTNNSSAAKQVARERARMARLRRKL